MLKLDNCLSFKFANRVYRVTRIDPRNNVVHGALTRGGKVLRGHPRKFDANKLTLSVRKLWRGPHPLRVV